MKQLKAILTVLLLGLTVLSFGQSEERPNTVELSFGANDSYGPYRNINWPQGIANTENLNEVYSIGYYRYISKFLDIGVAANVAPANDIYDRDFNNTSAIPFTEAADRLDKGSHANVDLIARYKFFNDIDFGRDAALKFFLYQSIGADYYSELDQVLNVDNGFTANVMPFGLGFKLTALEKIHLRAQMGHKFTLFDKGDNYWTPSAGLGFNFGPPIKKDEPVVEEPEVVTPPPPKDTDGDGIYDKDDDCVDTPGVAEYNGCPPPPPPPSDRDGDGVVDTADRCPDTVGVASNAGCPVVTQETKTRLETIARAIQFETNSDALKADSRRILDEVVSIMGQYPDYKLSIAGHTDSVGDAGYNQTLSQKRAAAVKAYLQGKGVSGNRMSSTGYGETQPIATNDNAEGRARNRRVELRLAL